MAQRPETTRLNKVEESEFRAWAKRNGITDVDHPDSHYDYRGYWKSVRGADHPQGEHFPDTFKQHGHPTFSVESQYSRGPNDGGHWQGDQFIPSVGGDTRIRQDILPDFRPRNRAAEVRNSFAYKHPTLAGIGEGTANVAKGVALFIPEAIKGLASFSIEDLRNPDVQKEIRDNGWGDPVAMLHEAIKAKARGEPVGSTEYAMSLLKGTALMGYNLQRQIQGGEALYGQTQPGGKLSILDTDVPARERARGITEMLGNAGLLAVARRGEVEAPRNAVRARIAAERQIQPNLPLEGMDRPTFARRAAAQAERTPPVTPEPAPRQISTGPGPEETAGLRRITEALQNRPAGIRAPFLPEGAPAILGAGSGLENIRSYFRNTVGNGEALKPIERGGVNAERATQMANTYENLKSDPNNPEVRAAYDAFNRETEAQAEALKQAGYSWEFTDKDPYPPTAGGSKAMLADLKNKHIKVYATQGEQSHPLMTNAQNNLFRAVHEILGHGVDQVPFSAWGEENAYRSHAQMYSDLARRAMATETRGQNSHFNYGPNKDVPAPQRPFAQQKAALWPQEMLGEYNTFPSESKPAASNERIAAPSVLGADGNYYTGLNHAFAAERAAEVMRSTPEGMAAMARNGGSAIIRGSEGFKTDQGRYISRSEARGMAAATGQAPNLAPQYTALHSSDLAPVSNPPVEVSNPRMTGPDTPAATGETTDLGPTARTIYRVQHPTTGLGPYQHPSPGEARGSFLYTQPESGLAAGHQPTWGAQSNYGERYPYPPQDYQYGFPTREALNRWFSPAERGHLTNLGFKLHEFAVPTGDVMDRPEQIAYNPENADYIRSHPMQRFERGQLSIPRSDITQMGHSLAHYLDPKRPDSFRLWLDNVGGANPLLHEMLSADPNVAAAVYRKALGHASFVSDLMPYEHVLDLFNKGGPGWRKWYGPYSDALLNRAGVPENPARNFLRTSTILSTRKPPVDEVLTALRTWDAYEHGEPITTKTTQHTRAITDIARRLISGEPWTTPEGFRFGERQKTSHYFLSDYLGGESDSPTADTHHARGYLGPNLENYLRGPKKELRLTDPQWAILNARTIADALRAGQYTPDWQAGVWGGVTGYDPSYGAVGQNRAGWLAQHLASGQFPRLIRRYPGLQNLVDEVVPTVGPFEDLPEEP